MKRTFVQQSSLALLISAVFLSGCSVIENDKVDYKSAGKAPPLDIPPDLTKIANDPRYAIPSTGSITASGYEGRSSTAVGTSPVSIGDVRIERLGNQRWLVVNRDPEKLWDTIADFWKDNGFLLLQQDKAVGIMETDWAENRAKIPQDFIRKSIGKLLDSLYSTAERDKFRTRIERSSNGQAEIFISHRGMQEVDRKVGSDVEIVWAPRAADPELEVEFLRRLMLKLGATPDQAQVAAGTSAAKPVSELATDNGQPVLRLPEGFDRAWRRVGLSLDRTGFTVEDRDRSKGLYFVRYVESVMPQKEAEGFFGKLFGKSGPTSKTPVKYQIAIKSADAGSRVLVLNDKGSPETSGAAAQILKLLQEDLK